MGKRALIALRNMSDNLTKKEQHVITGVINCDKKDCEPSLNCVNDNPECKGTLSQTGHFTTQKTNFWAKKKWLETENPKTYYSQFKSSMGKYADPNPNLQLEKSPTQGILLNVTPTPITNTKNYAEHAQGTKYLNRNEEYLTKIEEKMQFTHRERRLTIVKTDEKASNQDNSTNTDKHDDLD